MPRFFTEKGEMFETENIICCNYGGHGTYNVWTRVNKGGLFGREDSVGPIYQLSDTDRDKLLQMIGPFRSLADKLREEAETEPTLEHYEAGGN